MNKPIDSKALDEAIYTLMRDEFQLKESKDLQMSMIRLKVAGLVEIRPCSAIDFTQFGRGWFIRK